ncbi:transposase [Brucella sp. 10RB9215]|uniref:transposase n=1 Tax=Brucella sp. 10RB9215 TaxID=1149953 RepID=UPI0010FCE2A9
MLYSNGCTDDEWAVIAPLLQPMGKVGRPREHDPRMLWNTIQYIAVTGCPNGGSLSESSPGSTAVAIWQKFRIPQLQSIEASMFIASIR